MIKSISELLKAQEEPIQNMDNKYEKYLELIEQMSLDNFLTFQV